MDAFSMGAYNLNDLVNLVGKPTLMTSKSSTRLIAFECNATKQFLLVKMASLWLVPVWPLEIAYNFVRATSRCVAVDGLVATDSLKILLQIVPHPCQAASKSY